jgi:hypothetical protein
MTSAQAYWGLLDTMATTVWWVGLSLVIPGVVRLKVVWRKHGMSFSIRFRTSVAYAIMACSALMHCIADLASGDLFSACLAMAGFAMDVWFYHYFRKHEDDDEDDEHRKKALRELGGKAQATLKKMLGRLNPAPAPQPVPVRS